MATAKTVGENAREMQDLKIVCDVIKELRELKKLGEKKADAAIAQVNIDPLSVVEYAASGMSVGEIADLFVELVS
jgi:hypothetical protein